jgi:hypothetical protein
MKPIFLTPEEKIELKKELEASIDKGLLVDGSFSFSKKYTRKSETQNKIKVYYTSGAYVKMLKLLQNFSSEVGWHGLIRRLSPSEFLIYDILMFKQTVTGSTVNTDDEEYVKFMMNLTEEQANNMYFYGHSHVNMATTPSTVDINYQKNIVSSLNGKGFYLFQIWNKSLASTSILYDFESGLLYEDKDIEMDILDDEGFSVTEFIKESEAMVIKQTYSTSKPATAAYKPAATAKSAPSATAKSSKKKADNVVAVQDRLIVDEDDNGDDYYGLNPNNIQYFPGGYVYNGIYYSYE